MIPAREVLELRAEWLLDAGVIEKDQVVGWLLAGIANDPDLAGTWVFKGGTCLRKCYFETYRLSEDLDFTVVNGGPETPEELVPVFARIAGWLREEAGIEVIVDERSFVGRRNLRGKPTTEARLAYRGPNPPPGRSTTARRAAAGDRALWNRTRSAARMKGTFNSSWLTIEA